MTSARGVLIALVVMGAACADDTEPTAAEKLASIDGEPGADYGPQLARLADTCGLTEERMGDMIVVTQQQLAERGHDESHAFVMDGLDTIIGDGEAIEAGVGCDEILATWATLST